MSLQMANYEDILTTYYHGTAAQVAAEHLGSLIRCERHSRLATLLRDYRVRAITDHEEITLRAATDCFLTCCSVMEVASLTGFVPNIQQTLFGMEMRIIIENEYVRRYYEEYYPTKLPQLFRCRLAGTNTIIEKTNRTGMNRDMLVFLALDRVFMEKLDDGILLRMLDSFTIHGYRFCNVVELINKPKEFINHLLQAPIKRDVQAQALNEFSLFMQFCFDLRQLMTHTESHKLLQSAMWNHYSYWFDIIGDELNEQLGAALAQFLNWKPRGDDKDAAKAVQTYVRDARGVLKDLTSRRYAEPVDRLLRQVS